MKGIRIRGPVPVILASVLLAAGAAYAQGSNPPAPNEEPGINDTLMEQTFLGNVRQTAATHYHTGHRYLVRAMKLEEKAVEAPPEKREKALAKVQKAYEDAVASYTQAIRTNPELFEAYAELGQAYRALDKNAEAIQVHNAALKLQPQDAENIYGRGEAFLGLNYLREAAMTYTDLAGDHREQAARLMASMKKWVADHREDPGEILPEAVETLATWIEQQESGSG